MKKKQGQVLKCKACLKQFYVPRYRVEKAKFCSVECQNHRQYERFFFTCEGCGKQCEDSPSRRNYKKKFCSMECRCHTRKSDKERRLEIKAHNILKRGTNLRGLRRYFFTIYEKKCAICSYDEYDFCLDLHHIDKDCTNNLPDNIIVLCVICHRKLHKKIINLEGIMPLKKGSSKKVISSNIATEINAGKKKRSSCSDCLQQSQQRKEAIIEYGRHVILTEDEIIYTGPDNEATINTGRDINKTRRRKNTQSEDSERRVMDVQDVPKTQTKRRRKTTDHKSND